MNRIVKTLLCLVVMVLIFAADGLTSIQNGSVDRNATSRSDGAPNNMLKTDIPKTHTSFTRGSSLCITVSFCSYRNNPFIRASCFVLIYKIYVVWGHTSSPDGTKP